MPRGGSILTILTILTESVGAIMSKRKLGRKPSERRETPESKAFRREMERHDISPEDRRMLERLLKYWVKVEVITEPGDHETFSRLCSFQGWLTLHGEPIPKVWPIVDVNEHEEFDIALCQAGLKKFVRPLHSSDYPIESKLVLVQDGTERAKLTHSGAI